MPTVPVLKGWDCADIVDLENWAPAAEDDVVFWLNLSIGTSDSAAADNFEVCVATPAGLNSDRGRRTRPKGRGTPSPIVLQSYSWPAVLEEIQARLRACSGVDWVEMQEKLRLQFAWEYEGMN